ncbi:TonB-dependent receptor [Terriglobus albidus]|uniref:TonB-dependent receptor n=1 Tax=Terriglobus albidus TaxID=1592106 RepID=UPI0021DFFF41|nr:TonB-dependent receptor [Terriglobus albidus]
MRHLLLAVFVSLLASVGVAQSTFRGGISGIVTDTSGAVIPGATVSVKNEATAQTYGTVSSSAGTYSIQDLPLGDYTVTIAFPGFASMKIDKVRVSAGSIFDLPAKMTVAQNTTVVEVDAAALTLDTTTQVQTYTIPKEEVQNIPLNGRSFTAMVNLLPGATGTSSVNGRAGINYMIEGVDNNDPANNGSAANQGGVGGIPGTLIPIDAVEEFSAQTQGGAETGKFAGASVNLVIKSGTNQLHGSLYYYDRNEFFAAMNPFLRATNVSRVNSGLAPYGKSKVRFHEFGGSLGGPIFKDKTFYFLTYERQGYILSQSTNTFTEPSTAYVAKATALLATKNIAPSPIALGLINTLWQPSMLTGPASANNYLPTNAAQHGYSNNLMLKLDQSINAKNKLSARWYWGQGSQTAPKGSQNPWYYQVAGMHVHNIAVILNSQVNAKITNQIVAGVDYFNQPFSDANPNVDASKAGFIVGLGPGNVQGAPTLSISGFDSTGQSPFSSRHDFSGHLSDLVSMSFGKHQIRTGGEYRRTQIYEVGNGAGGNGGTRGNFSFSGNRGFAAANGANVGTAYPSMFTYNGVSTAVDSSLRALADFLQLESNTSTLVNGVMDRIASVNNFNLYVQDGYQVTSSLNLTFGLRWDYLSPIGDDQKDLTVFRPNIAANALAPTGGLAVVGQDVSEPYKASSLQLAPRVGFSWQVPGLTDTLVRGSFGLYYDTPSTNTWLSSTGLLGNPAGTKPLYNQSLTNPNLGELIASSQGSIFPTSPKLPGACTGSTAATCPVASIAAVDPNFTTANTANYSLNVEKAIGKNMVAQVGYVGTQGKHLLNAYDLNQTQLGAGLSTTPIVNGFLPIQQKRPYISKFPNFGQIRQITSAGGENFNSLQALIKARNWHGLISEYSYTWSHNLGSNTALPTDNTNPNLDYGNLANDIRHQFKGFFTYDIPGMKRGPKWLTHDWQATSVLWLHGGKPITASSSANNSGLGLGEGADRASLSGNPLTCDSGSTCVSGGTSKSINYALSKGVPYIQWFNPLAIVSPAALTVGTTRVGQFYGPGYASVDLSIFKNVPLREGIRAQFRGEMFNVFNRYNYSNPTFAANSLTSNTQTTGQVTATAGGSSAPGIGAGEPFNVQLALKILF